MRFDRAMEQAYERDTGSGRSKRALLCNVLGAIVFALLTAINLPKLGPSAAPLESLRIGILCFCAATVMWQWLRLKRLSPFQRDGTTAVGALLMGLYIGVEAHLARDVLSVMLGGNLIFVLLFTGLVSRIEFPFTVVVCVLTLAAYFVGAFAHDALTHAIVLNNLALSASVAAISLSGNYVLERRERRAYLMQRLSLLHRDAVQASTEALRKLTLCDPLTSLANRRHFDTEIERLWHGAQLGGPPIGLLQIDVDFFKRYNDRYGHPMGDVCLQRIGEQLSAAAVSHAGLAARIGGEEFAVLLPGMDICSASAVAEQLCIEIRALAIAHIDSPAAAFVTISVGVASMRPAEAKHPATLMLAADLALYRAKREGRDRFAQAEPPGDPDHAVKAADRVLPNHPEHPPSGASDRVEQLEGLLASGFLDVRFPPEIESDYLARNSRKRQQRLAMLVLCGMAVTCGYVWLNMPLYADVAADFMRGTIALCGVLGFPWVLTLQRTLSWSRRELLLAGTTSMLMAGLLLMESQSRSPGMQSGMLTVSLALIVQALIAAPPVRFVLPAAVVLSVGAGVLAWWSEPADQARSLSAMSTLWTICIFALFGSYALDVSNRRGYLLRRLGEAQTVNLQDINADVQRLALTDALTQLPNRRHFESQLSACWQAARSADAPLAVLIIDLDHFKPYNDNYGHLAGDACLQSVAAFIARWCARQRPLAGQRVAAFSARMGGEEFGVLLPGHEAPSALAAAESLCAGLRDQRNPHAHSPVSDVLTASIGTASRRPSESPDVRQLLRVADEALYRAKSAGRNRASV